MVFTAHAYAWCLNSSIPAECCHLPYSTPDFLPVLSIASLLVLSVQLSPFCKVRLVCQVVSLQLLSSHHLVRTPIHRDLDILLINYDPLGMPSGSRVCPTALTSADSSPHPISSSPLPSLLLFFLSHADLPPRAHLVMFCS